MNEKHYYYLSQIHGGLSHEFAAFFIDIDEIGAGAHLEIGRLAIVGSHRGRRAIIVDAHLLGELQRLAIGLERILVA